MDVIREITDDNLSSISEINYSDFQAAQSLDSFQQLRREVRAEVLARHLEPENKPSCCRYWQKCLKVFFLIVVIGCIWLALSVPSIFYIMGVVKGQNATSSASGTYQDPNISNVSYPDMCIADEYTGSACRNQLAMLQQCLNVNGHDSGINITYFENQDSQESIAKNLFSFSSFISDDCREQLEPFACLYLFPLVTCNEEGRENKVYRPSRQTCESIKDHVCAKEWKLAEKFEAVISELPVCSNLDDMENEVNPLEMCEGTSVRNSSLNCSLNFRDINNSCVPICQQWSNLSPIGVKVSDILIIITSCFALVVGSAVFVLGCIRYKRIFTYPSVLVIYQTIPTVFLSGLSLVGFTARSKLFCSSENYIKSLLNPSPFCFFTGLAFHYFILQLVLLWFFHTVAVFQGTLFPFYTKRLKSNKKLKYVHMVMFVLGVFLPAVLVGIIAGVGEGFTLTRTPTIFCTAYQKHINYGCMILPISIVIAIGSTLLVFILWTVIKKHVQARRNKLRVNLNWTTEAKVLLIIMYHLILGVAVLTIFIRSILDVATDKMAELEYFRCESQGAPSNNICDRNSVKGDLISTTIAFILLGLYPAFNLIYTINIKELRGLLCMERKVLQVAPLDNRGNIQSIYGRPMGHSSILRPPTSNGGANHVTSSFSYGRPSTFRPLDNQ